MQLLQGNWVDLLILIILCFFVAEGIRVGFWASAANFLAFLVSLLLALKLYKFLSPVIRESFTLTHSLSNALAFFAVAIVLEAALSFVFWILIERLPLKMWKSKLNKIAGLVPSLLEGVVIVAFILTLIMSLPFPGNIKRDISESVIGGEAIKRTASIETKVEEIFGSVIQDTLTYLTVKPESKESVKLNVKDSGLKVDDLSENAMLVLVNKERAERSLKPLAWRPDLVPVARAHALDMWERKYFGHISPEGQNVGDRLKQANISYSFAGENLALAPTLQTAHNGLMNSEGHRANILNEDFRRIGIGVIDNGVYGKMFVQVFTD